MSEKCPKCGSRHDHLAQARANHGGTFYVCGTFVTSGGETSIEGETCLRRQLAQKDRELEQAKRDEEDERTNCHAAELALEWCKRDQEQSRQREANLKEALGTANFTIEQRKAGEAELRERLVAANRREAQALAVAARVKEWAAKEYDPMLPDNPLDLDTILADSPPVLAVVDGWAGCDCLWDDPDGEYGLHIPDTPDEDEPSTPVRVIVLGRDERGE